MGRSFRRFREVVMMKKQTPRAMIDGGNYIPKLMDLRPHIPRDTDSDIYFYHDDWCALYRGLACNCDPDVAIRPRYDVPR